MMRSRTSHWLAALACVGLVLPSQSMAETKRLLPQAQSGVRATPEIEDIALDAGQTFKGIVLREDGSAAVGTPVALQQLGQEIASVTTDETGHFTISGLRGGVYQVNAGRSMVVYRFWAHQTAPPTALPSATLVDTLTVRGQKPFREIFTSNTFIIAAVIAAAIAIPIAIHNARNERGSGS